MEVVYSSTKELADAMQAGQVSATEVLMAHLAQIERHNPVLNAVTTMDAERALARAREADAARASGNVWGPLHGVPFTIKDAHATAGMRTTSGYPQLADYVPDTDSTVVARLKAAGAILVGKTNVPVMLGDYQSNNPIFGRTNNPWDLARTPGGSSGGAAAALAAGMTPFEIGTDLGGSIRIPAHFCGVFGLKPTEHRVSLAGLVPGLPPPRPIRIMSCIGPMARDVSDLALLYSIIAGADGLDTDVPPMPIDDPVPTELTELRVAIAPTFPGFPVASDVRAAVVSVARRLENSGPFVDEPNLPPLDFSADAASVGDLIGMLTNAKRQTDNPTTLGQYLGALHRRDQSIIAWERFFEEWDVLLSPVSMITAFPHCDTGSPLLVDGEEIGYWTVSAHSALFNYSGHPALSLPCGLDQEGLPIGVQLVTKRWDDSRLLSIAHEISALNGVFLRPPGYEAATMDVN